MSESRQSVVCFGEILWDFLPEGAYPGGAPFNVAYHLGQLGLGVHVVSAVGQDLLGDELLRRLRHWGLETTGIGRHLGLPTGYVRASLSATGDAAYEIATEVAWDQIIPGEDSIRATVAAQALVFGSLAQRSQVNRAALDRLLAVLPTGALRVLDVNLRTPYDDLALVRSLVSRTDLVKLNAEEAARLIGDSAGEGREETHARALASEGGASGMVCITSGGRGAGLLANGIWHWVDAAPVTVADTVGAGDAFTAGLLAGLLQHREQPSAALRRACRLGEFVASHHGATPAHPAAAGESPS